MHHAFMTLWPVDTITFNEEREAPARSRCSHRSHRSHRQVASTSPRVLVPQGWSVVSWMVLLCLWLAGGAMGQDSEAVTPQQQQSADQSGSSDQDEEGTAAERPVTYDEIVVTAQKREEALLEVPVSVTAFTAEKISEYNITDIQEISIRTPGMHYGNFPDQKLAPLSLRGIIGDSGSAGADPAVSQYVDEVYIGQGAGAFIDLFDIERAEVLRGPQGLYFGRNSIGGAVSYTTMRPRNEFEARVEGTYGDYDQHRAAALVTGPLVKDRLTAKLSLVSNGRDGTFENLWLNREVNTIGNWSGRGQLQWIPTDVTHVTFTAEHSEIDQESLFFETLKYNDDSFFVQVLDLYGLPRNQDPWDRKVYGDIEQPETLDLSGYSATIDTVIGNVALTSITSYREHDYTSSRDTDASGLLWAYDGDPEQVDRFSQELRVTWAAANTSFLAGVYYFDQTAANQSFIGLGPDLLELLAGLSTRIDAGSDAVTDTTSYAGFANATFNLSERADMSVGLRYTRDEKDIDYFQDDPLGVLGGTFRQQAGDDWGAVTPALNVRYRFSDAVRGYVAVSRGFKSGGFNDALGSVNGIAFGPEYLWNYELGLKSRLADGKVSANFALYYMDWTDIQISVDNPDTPTFDPIIANAGAAHSSGIEGEILATPSRHWMFGANFAWIDAAYDGGTLPDGRPLDKIPYSPDYTASLSAEYRRPISSSLEWFVGAEMLNQGEFFLTDDNQEDGRVDPYTFANARLGISSAKGRWRVTAWGKNLSDKTVKQRLFDLYDQDLIGQKYIVLNDPRMYGVTLGVTF